MRLEMQETLKLVIGVPSNQFFLEEKCKQCGLCFAVCPDDAIPVNQEQKREDFNYDYCKGCGICSKVCPFGAIEMK